jgi:2-alkyl-3-oxoalkanoate reductase
MKVLVTGGGGFLGQALCRGLVERGHQVASFNRGHYPELEALGVRQLRGDLADGDAVLRACEGVEALFHNAAKAGAWGSLRRYFRANVLGTRNVIAACRARGIGRLVYTSTPSVTHRATRPVEGGTADTVPYGEDLKAPYAATKLVAEREVLAANDAALATIALRPRLIWGPGDNQLLPRLVARARAGRLRWWAAATTWSTPPTSTMPRRRISMRSSTCARRGLRRARVLHQQRRAAHDARDRQRPAAAAGAPPVTRSIPFAVAYAAGIACEGLWHALPLRGEPPMTRFLAEQLATTHWYDMAPARADFGYVPRVSFEEGLRRLSRAWSPPA